MVFGMMYWLVPRLYQTPLYCKKLATVHFWVATIGIVLYVDLDVGRGHHPGPDVARVRRRPAGCSTPTSSRRCTRLMPMYWVRALGGSLYIAGVVIWRLQHLQDLEGAPGDLRRTIEVDGPAAWCRPHVSRARRRPGRTGAHWHRRWEGMPVLFTVLTVARGARRVAVRDRSDVPDRGQRADASRR